MQWLLPEKVPIYHLIAKPPYLLKWYQRILNFWTVSEVEGGVNVFLFLDSERGLSAIHIREYAETEFPKQQKWGDI